MLLLGAAMTAVFPVAAYAGPKIIVGAGPKGSSYFSVSKLFCDSFAQQTEGYRCRAARYSSSESNLHGLRREKFDIVIARSDHAQQSLRGIGNFKYAGPDTELRSLFSTYSVALNIIVKNDSTIKSLHHLNGKNVVVGGSAAPIIAELSGDKGWDVTGFSSLPLNGIKALGELLCSGRIDAVTMALTFPSEWLRIMSDSCSLRLVGVTGARADVLTKRRGALSKAQIPRNTYVESKNHTKTLGYRVAFVTNTQMSTEDAYAFVKFTFENLDSLKRQHPVLSTLNPSEMIRDGLPAPLHPGAARYYREQGWIK